MEYTLERPSLSLSTLVLGRLNITRHLAGLVSVLVGDQRHKTPTNLSDPIRRDVGLNPNFSIRDNSQPYIWRT